MEAVLTRLGAVPVPLNPPPIYAAATQQEIDGAVMAWDVLRLYADGREFPLSY